jgi:dihydrofolate reductase
MKAIYYTASSLDGYIADASGSLEWLSPFEDQEESSYPAFIKDVGTMVMGSHTYEWLLNNYIYSEPHRPKPWPHEMPTWVFSSRALRTVPGADIRFLHGDVSETFPDIRTAAAGKNVWVAGGGDVAAQLHAAGLLDEIMVQVAPVVLGGGAPFFTKAIVTPPLTVLQVKPHRNGLVEMTLQVPKPT